MADRMRPAKPISERANGVAAGNRCRHTKPAIEGGRHTQKVGRLPEAGTPNCVAHVHSPEDALCEDTTKVQYTGVALSCRPEIVFLAAGVFGCTGSTGRQWVFQALQFAAQSLKIRGAGSSVCPRCGDWFHDLQVVRTQHLASLHPNRAVKTGLTYLQRLEPACSPNSCSRDRLPAVQSTLLFSCLSHFPTYFNQRRANGTQLIFASTCSS